MGVVGRRLVVESCVGGDVKAAGFVPAPRFVVGEVLGDSDEEG